MNGRHHAFWSFHLVDMNSLQFIMAWPRSYPTSWVFSDTAGSSLLPWLDACPRHDASCQHSMVTYRVTRMPTSHETTGMFPNYVDPLLLPSLTNSTLPSVFTENSSSPRWFVKWTAAVSLLWSVS